MKYCYLKSPIGDLLLAGTEDGLCLISFPEGRMRTEPKDDWIEDERPFKEARRQLTDYFDGKRKAFDLRLRPSGTTFQMSVLDELRNIPYGTTASYGEIARRIGRPSAARAVGAANGRNPLPIVIPCHRVVGSKGDLTGFGGGIETKKALLDLERSHAH